MLTQILGFVSVVSLFCHEVVDWKLLGTYCLCRLHERILLQFSLSYAFCVIDLVPSVLWHCWLGARKCTWPVKIDWWGVGVVICLDQGAGCVHLVQLMPLHPQTPSSLASFKSRLVLCFWYRLSQVVLEKRPLNGCSGSFCMIEWFLNSDGVARLTVLLVEKFWVGICLSTGTWIVIVACSWNWRVKFLTKKWTTWSRRTPQRMVSLSRVPLSRVRRFCHGAMTKQRGC